MSKKYYFKEISYKNFKSLNNLELSNLKRINIISGANGIGKSTLLESIFFILDRRSHISLLRSSQWRNIDFNSIGGIKSFFNFNTKEKISSIECIVENDKNLSFKLEPRIKNLSTQFAFANAFEEKNNINYFSFSKNENNSYSIRWKINDTEEDVYHINQRIDGYDMQAVKQGTSFIPATTIISPFTRNIPNDIPQKFSAAFKNFGKEEIIKDLKLIREDIENIELLFENSAPILYAEINNKIKLPISALGDGVKTLLTIITSFINCKNGIVLLDEFESAIYYKTLPKIWGLIEKYAIRHNVQVFCVTHSIECIRYAYEGLDNKNNISFYRLEKKENSLISTNYNHSELEAAFDTGWEIR